MAEASNINLKDILSQWKGAEQFKELTWSGSFDEYLAIVKHRPNVTRNAFQRMYDMIMEAGTKEYIDVKKRSFL